MAEHDADREPEEKDAPPGEEQGPSFDEAAAWAAIVAGYGDEPPDPPGAKPFKSVEDLALLEPGRTTRADGPDDADRSGPGPTGEPRPETPRARGRRRPTTADGRGRRARGQAARQLRRLRARRRRARATTRRRSPSEDDFDEDDEGHFVPPEPPPLPAADTTAKFAWLAVLGGPVLLLLAVLLRLGHDLVAHHARRRRLPGRLRHAGGADDARTTRTRTTTRGAARWSDRAASVGRRLSRTRRHGRPRRVRRRRDGQRRASGDARDPQGGQDRQVVRGRPQVRLR